MTREDIHNAVIEGALLRIRPIVMTVAAIIADVRRRGDAALIDLTARFDRSMRRASPSLDTAARS